MKTATRILLSLCASLSVEAAAARTPVVVELFTAQGCTSCGPANALIGKLADRSDVVPLTWSVDYWDYLGWKDTFAEPEFAGRQKVYDRRFDLRDVYTPQFVVGGVVQASGDQITAVDAMIADAAHHMSPAPQIQLSHDGEKVAVGSGRRLAGGSDVWLIRFDPRPQTVEIKDGDNRGTKVAERNVVRQLVRLGAWRGRPVSFRAPPATTDGLATLILVQEARGGKIVGVLVQDAARPSTL